MTPYLELRLNNNIKATTKLVSATATMLAGGNAKDITLSANVGESAVKHNRRLHPSEEQVLAELQKGKTPEEQRKLELAAKYLVRASAGVSVNDEQYSALSQDELEGSKYIKEQQMLSSLSHKRNKSLEWAKTMEQAKMVEGLSGNPDKYTQRTFDYNALDYTGDAFSHYEGGLYRTGQFGQALLGSLGTVAMTAGAIGIESYTLGLGTPEAITLAGGAYMSYEHTKSSINNITAPYQLQEGLRVQQSFKTPVSGSYITEKSCDIAMSSAVGIGGAKLLSSAAQTLQKTVPKVKSVLFKTGKGNNVATKTTTAKLTTTPDSGHLYESETSSRIGISAIDGKKDKRVHEVLGGYGENISAKDFKLQVQAEKALDVHAKKTALAGKKLEKKEVTLELKQKPGTNQFAFEQKVEALDDLAKQGKLVKTKPGKRDPNKTKAHRKDLNNRIDTQYGTRNPEFAEKAKAIIKKSDMDHIHELQLGGPDIVENLKALLKGPNRSVGRQIQHQIKNLPEGTKVDSVVIIKQK